MNKRFLLRACASAGLAATMGIGLAGTALAQEGYPAAPITLVVPFAAGSGTDAVARVVANKLGERLKQAVVVDNRAGANAQIAAAHVVKAKPDGYTLFMTTNTSHSANPWLVKGLKYDPIKDFTPVARVGELPFALVVHPSVPARTVAELIAYAKSHPDKLSYGTPNSTSLVASETFKYITGTQITGVPYKSSPQALTDVMGNQIQMYVADLGSAWGTLKTERVRTLAVTAAKGSQLLPNVPAIGKTLPGFDITSWNGIFGPAGMPPAIITRYHEEVVRYLRTPATNTLLSDLGAEVIGNTPIEFSSFVQAEIAKWMRVIPQLGITL